MLILPVSAESYASSWTAVMQRSAITALDPLDAADIPQRPADPGSKTAIVIAALQNLAAFQNVRHPQNKFL